MTILMMCIFVLGVVRGGGEHGVIVGRLWIGILNLGKIIENIKRHSIIGVAQTVSACLKTGKKEEISLGLYGSVSPNFSKGNYPFSPRKVL